MSALVIDEFLSGSEQSSLSALAYDYRKRGVLEGNPSGPKRFRRKVFDTVYYDQQIKLVAGRIVDRLGLHGCAVDPYLGWIISYIEPGGFIKPHIDRHLHYQKTGDRHMRCNVLVQGDDASAYPIIAGEPLIVRERGLWAFFASDYPHGTDILQGDKPRIVYQFGFVVPGDYRLGRSA